MYNTAMVIVALGNEGTEYEKTRHNVAWRVVEHFLKKHAFREKTRIGTYVSDVAEGMYANKNVSVLFPTTAMNNSGVSVKKFFDDDKNTESPSELLVVHDDIDLPFGEVKVSFDRGAGGHNGVASVIEKMASTKFGRIRVGIGKKSFFGTMKRPKGDALADFVLANFTPSEEKQLPNIAEKVTTALEYSIEKGIPYAMQECNK